MHFRRFVVLLLACFAAGACAAASRADDVAAQKAVRAQRLALLKAVNAHDAKAVGALVDASYAAKQKDGQTMNRDQMLQMMTQLFQSAPDFKESLTLGKITVNADMAQVENTSVLTFTAQGQKQKETQHYVQTWKKVGGKWMLTGEQEQ
jgi:ketosteroid isomerase-like protein